MAELAEALGETPSRVTRICEVAKCLHRLRSTRTDRGYFNNMNSPSSATMLHHIAADIISGRIEAGEAI
ncbi:MAG: hypothetical protein ACRC14_18940, partial [Paracoccaceae bacterium]